MFLLNITWPFFHGGDFNSQQAMHQNMHLMIIGIGSFLDISVTTVIKFSFFTLKLPDDKGSHKKCLENSILYNL